jgi:RNA polymerase sporulation-specific sigma factor
MAKSDKRKPIQKVSGPIAELEYHELVDIVRGNGYKPRKESAYNEIENRIKPKVNYIIKQFFIPGCNHDDVLQEALYALRFKAIPDYDLSKGLREDPYPFDKFAVLCIRRHLSTILKSSFQNRKKALNTSLSLDQDRSNQVDDFLHLSDIIPHTEGTVGGDLGDKEYVYSLFSKLMSELSILEQRVFKLYSQKFSYEEISIIINRYYKKRKMKKKTNVKSIDNALSRIKQKAKDIYDKYNEDS